MNTHVLTEGGYCQLLPSPTEQNTKYFFRNPQSKTSTTPFSIATTAVNLSMNSFTDIDKEGTIAFYIKIIGFTTASTSPDILNYGSNLKLTYVSDITKYNSVSYDKYGLSLINNVSGSPEAIVNDRTFRDRIGRWVFISLAYYYDFAKITSFPPMLNFMINEITLQVSSSAALAGYDIKNFVLPKTTFCLIANLTVFSKYLIGAYGLINNNTDFAAVSSSIYKQYFIPGSSISNCVITSNIQSFWAETVICTPNYNNYFFPAPVALSQQFKNFSGVQNVASVSTACIANKCSNGCFYNTNNGYNNNNNSCWCFMNNSNVSMILKNNNINICYRK